MKHHILFFSLLSVLSIAPLSACQAKSYSHFELVTQPKLLEKALTACVGIESDYCKEVENSRKIVSNLMVEHQLNQEQFGERILQLQSEMAVLPLSDHQQRDALNEQIQMRLAIVAMTGP